MFKVFEKIEDFLEGLASLEKISPVYISVVHMKQDDVHTASIRLQYIDTDLFCNVFNYQENIKPIRLVDVRVFNMIPDEKQRDLAQKQYEAEIDMFNESVRVEYEKAMELLTKMGYVKIINASVV
jgi:hypothetical protein